MKSIPDQLRNNELTIILDDIRSNYLHLSRIGRIDGLVIADQDAKVLATNTFFDSKINYWDIGAIGAALYGVAKQGKDFFSADQIERSMLLYNTTQFFVQYIGSTQIHENKNRELILIVIGDKKINIGLILMQMQKFTKQIQDQVEQNEKTQEMLLMSEKEFTHHLNQLKKELFQLAKEPEGEIDF